MATFRLEDMSGALPGHERVFEATRPLVFLDIDDVLCVYNTFNSRDVLAALAGDSTVNAEKVLSEVFHPVARHYLSELHDEYLPLYIISSSWTLHLTREQLCETFHRTGIGFVGDSLHGNWCTVRRVGSNRRVEIEGWLTYWLQSPTLINRPPVLIIDDLHSGRSLYASALASVTVFCTAGIGLTYREFQNARTILKSQLDKVEKFQYKFTLILDISDCVETLEEIIELLGAAGITDAVVDIGNPSRILLTLNRSARSLDEAKEPVLKTIFVELPCAQLFETK